QRSCANGERRGSSQGSAGRTRRGRVGRPASTAGGSIAFRDSARAVVIITQADLDRRAVAMKCPKCDYLGFETGDRCKNCGYDFSLLAAPEVEPADLSLKSPERDAVTIGDLWLAH